MPSTALIPSLAPGASSSVDTREGAEDSWLWTVDSGDRTVVIVKSQLNTVYCITIPVPRTSIEYSSVYTKQCQTSAHTKYSVPEHTIIYLVVSAQCKFWQCVHNVVE